MLYCSLDTISSCYSSMEIGCGAAGLLMAMTVEMLDKKKNPLEYRIRTNVFVFVNKYRACTNVL